MRACALAALLLCAHPADGDDAREGLRVFARGCAVCHAVVAPDGTAVVAGGGTGPNLWGVVGRAVAASADYARYGDALRTVGAAGTVWTAAALDAYLADPAGWLRAETGDKAARSRMAFRLRDAEDRARVIAWLAALGAPP